MIRPGIYRDRNGVLVHVISADDDCVVLRYADGMTVTLVA